MLIVKALKHYKYVILFTLGLIKCKLRRYSIYFYKVFVFLSFVKVYETFSVVCFSRNLMGFQNYCLAVTVQSFLHFDYCC